MHLEILALHRQLAVLRRRTNKRASLKSADWLLWVMLSRLQISSTVAKYTVRQRKPPSQTWRTFLDNHVQQLVAIDFLVVPTVSFRLLFVFVVLGHHRRHAIHFNVTAHPTAEWTGRQIAEAFPWDSAPRYLLHDRDSIYGAAFHQRVGEMDIREVLTAPRSPLAEPLCRAFYRLLATGVPGPHNYIQRIFLAAYSKSILRVLRNFTDTSGVGEGRAKIENNSTSRNWNRG
jgi:hypothetical protein